MIGSSCILFLALATAYAGTPPSPIPAKKLPSLLKMLESASLSERVAAMKDIGYVSPATEVRKHEKLLCGLLSDPAPEIREMTLKTMWRRLEGNDLVEACVRPALKDKDDRVVRAALMVVGKLFAQSKKAFPRVEALLDDENHEVAYRAAQTIGRLGLDSGVEKTIQTWAKMLDKKVSLEVEEVYVLSKDYSPAIEMDRMGNRAPELIRSALSSESVRNEVVPHLLRSITFRKPLVRVVSIKVMKWMEFISPEIMEALFLVVKNDKAPAVRIYALEASADLLKLKKDGVLTAADLNVDPAEYRSLMLSLTKSKFEGERIHSVRALGALREGSSEVVDALANALEDSSEKVRVYALAALGKLGPKASAAVPAIETLLQRKNRSMRDTAWAVKALQQIATPRSIAYAKKVMAQIEQEEEGSAKEK